jgi:hypothetical protein
MTMEKIMKESLVKEIKGIIEYYNLNCSVKEFKDKVDWIDISVYQSLSEDFIREFQDKVNWNCIPAFQHLSEDFIREFQNKVDWIDISVCQSLSEDFIREFQDKVNWNYISECQHLSEDFIREFQDKVAWYCISSRQSLSEDFIREFQDKVDWYYISEYQHLSEDFIREFKDKVNWNDISCYQSLSEDFIREFQDKIDIETQKENHKKKSLEDKKKEAKGYAKKYNLKIDDKYLYAYRDHDKFGRGTFNKTKFYEPGIYYRDWHCDMNKDNLNSFGFGIWPQGNTPVKIKTKDWGVSVDKNDGKARVWGFEIISTE